MDTRHWLTTAGIVALIGTVAGLGMNVGMMGLIIATALILLRTVDEAQAIQRMPWGVILMVTGVTVLVSMMQETQGLALITSSIANVSTPRDGRADRGVRHRPRLGLQQHVRRRAAGVPADGCRSSRSGSAGSIR